MSSWGAVTQTGTERVRRVREEVRDGVAVVVVSALGSSAVAVLVTVVTKLAS